MISYSITKAITDYLNHRGEMRITFTDWVVDYGGAFRTDDNRVYFETEEDFIAYRLKYSSPRYV